MKYILILLIILLVSCASKVFRKDLLNEEYVLTPKHGFQVANSDDLESIDQAFDEFVECFLVTGSIQKYLKYKIAVVPKAFKCDFHNGSCAGEFIPSLHLIIVTRYGMKSGTLKHEWGHAGGQIKNEETPKSNIDEVEHCFSRTKEIRTRLGYED